MKYLSFGVVVLVSAAGIAAQTPVDKANDKIAKEPVTLTGCVEAGKAADTFILTHVVRADTATTSPMPQPSVSNPTATPPITTPPATPPTDQPAPTATSGTMSASAIFWLDSPEKLKPHVGHKVSVTGTLDDDVDKTKVTGDDKVKIEAERGTRKVEPKEGSAGAIDAKAAKTGDKQEGYKVKVKSVTMISATCS
jgi:hypothetical protein